MLRGETLRFERLPDDLPEDAAQDRETVCRIGLKSNLTIPIVVGGQHVCALATGTVHAFRGWPDHVVERVRLAGQILASGFYRKRVETQLLATVATLEQARDELGMRLEEIGQLKDRLEAENAYLRTEFAREAGFDGIIGQGPAILDVLAKVAQVAPTDSSVLLLGETGTGKELLAHAIHDKSPRRSASLVTVNCAALPPSLIESELFGHEKGAFTGATGPKSGPLRAGPRRHALSRRDRRAVRRSAGEAAAGAAAGRVRAGRRVPYAQGGRAHRGRHQRDLGRGHG